MHRGCRIPRDAHHQGCVSTRVWKLQTNKFVYKDLQLCHAIFYNVGFNVVHRLTILFYNRHVLEKDNDKSWITKYLTLKKLYTEMNVIIINCFLLSHPCSKMYRYIPTLYFMISIKYSNYE